MLGLLLCIVIFLATLLFLNDWLSKPPGSPPGPFAWPLIGSLPLPGTTLDQYLLDCRAKYGDIFRLQIGSLYTVFICEYEAIKEAFNNSSVQGRPNYFIATLNPYKGRGIATSSGNVWKDNRRFTIRHLKDAGMRKIGLMEDIISFEANILVKDFSKYTGIPTELPWSVNAAVFNVIWKLAADKRFEIDSKQVNVLHNLLHDMMQFMQNKGFFLNMFPVFAKSIPLFIKKMFFSEDMLNMYRQQITEIFQDVINEHKEDIDEKNPRDLIDNFLLEINKTKDDDSARLIDEDIGAVLVDLFVGGSETAASALRWYLLYMAKYPKIQTKVQNEIDKVVGKDRLISVEDKERLPYFEATVLECLRIKPIAKIAAPHAVDEDTYIKGYYIQKDCTVNAHLQACHLDKKFWKKPEEFYPEHFINEDGTVDSKKEGFVPFSIGKRICFGENLARMEIFIILGSLMQNFSFSAAPGEKLFTEPNPSDRCFNIPQPFKLIISKRD